jgi:uncharacterized membrane protein YbjE (DUF340 family)
MGPGRLILIAVLAGIYSGILDQIEESFGLKNIVSTLILVLLIFSTGVILYKTEEKNSLKS